MRRLPLPIHRIIRRPNFEAASNAPTVIRDSIVKNHRELVDPATGKRLLLIGTLNASPIMAEQTVRALKAFKPDTLLVQAPQDWYAQVKNTHSGKRELTQADVHHTPYNFSTWQNPRNFREAVFRVRLWLWRLYSSHMLGFKGRDANVLQPGVEVFRALELARAHNAQIIYAGFEFNPRLVKNFEQEKRMDVLPQILRSIWLPNDHWRSEKRSLWDALAVQGLSAFSEHADDTVISWFIKYFEIVAPHQKKLLVDWQDEELFIQAFRADSDRIALLVNQWHVPGIEHHWRNHTGTQLDRPAINPIGDMDINALVRTDNANAALQRFSSKLCKSEPASNSLFITQYVKEATEWERVRHAFFQGYNDPELEHALYNGENDHVANMPYKVHHH